MFGKFYLASPPSALAIHNATRIKVSQIMQSYKLKSFGADRTPAVRHTSGNKGGDITTWHYFASSRSFERFATEWLLFMFFSEEDYGISRTMCSNLLKSIRKQCVCFTVGHVSALMTHILYVFYYHPY